MAECMIWDEVGWDGGKGRGNMPELNWLMMYEIHKESIKKLKKKKMRETVKGWHLIATIREDRPRWLWVPPSALTRTPSLLG